jgi:ABC-type multidrug transport system ATPase subunit
VRELRREGTTILLTTQYLEEADQLADRIAVIDRGKVINVAGLGGDAGSAAVCPVAGSRARGGGPCPQV